MDILGMDTLGFGGVEASTIFCIIILFSVDMSYPEIGVDGEVNPCYFLMREAEHCYHSRLYPATDCKKESDNFLECHNRNKQTKLMNELNLRLRRAKIVNVPHYDSANDRFVFDDGRVVANNDPIFARFKWA